MDADSDEQAGLYFVLTTWQVFLQLRHLSQSTQRAYILEKRNASLSSASSIHLQILTEELWHVSNTTLHVSLVHYVHVRTFYYFKGDKIEWLHDILRLLLVTELILLLLVTILLLLVTYSNIQ